MRSTLPTLPRRLAQCSRGAAAIEYALLVALIGCAVVLAMGGAGASVNNTMSAVKDELPGAAPIDFQTAP